MVNHNRIKRGRNGTKLHVSHQDNLTVVLGKNNLDSGPRACGPGTSVFTGFFVTPPNDAGSPRKLTPLFTGIFMVVSGHGFTFRVNVTLGLLVGRVMLGSTPNFVQVVHGTFLRGLRSRLHVLGSVFYWALFGPDVSFGLGSSQLYSYRHQTLYRRSYGGIGSRLHVLGSGLRWALFGPYVSLGFGSGPLWLGRHE